MGLTMQSSSTAKVPPKLPDGEGIYTLRFDGVREDEIKGGKYGDDVFIWELTVFHEGKVAYDEGEPIEVEKVTGRSVNTKSKTVPGAVKVLKALMTPAEFAAFENDEPIDADELIGRFVQGDLSYKDNGWIAVGDIIRAPKGTNKAAA